MGRQAPIVLIFLTASVFALMHCLPTEGEGDVLKLAEKERIKTNILNRLGMTELPSLIEPLTPDEEATVEAFKEYLTAKEARRARAKKSTSENPYLKHFSTYVGKLHKQGTNVEESSTKNPADNDPPQYIVQGYSVHFYLDSQQNTTMGKVVQMELMLFQGLEMLHQSDPHLHIEIKVATDGPSPTVSTKHFGIEEPGYIPFDITPLLQPWITNGSKGSLVLKVSTYCTNSIYCNEPLFADELENWPPKLIISKELVEDSSQQRLKRKLNEPEITRCLSDEITCCLHPLTINFWEDLGLDFIIQPREFYTNYCQGVCDFHGSESHRYNILGRLDSSPVEPCCVAHTTQSLEVLYRVNGTLIIDELLDAIVTSCRCG